MRVEKARKVVKKAGEAEPELPLEEVEEIQRLAETIAEDGREGTSNQYAGNESYLASAADPNFSLLAATINQAVPRRTQRARRKRA